MFSLFKKYCQTCGKETNSDKNLVRFGRQFCSENHANQYVEGQKNLENLDRQIMELNKLPKSKSRGRCCG